MGTKIKDILQTKEIGYDALINKTLVVDSHNMLYQFLSTIRTPDGTPLKDSKGNVTSHLTGLFARTTNLMQKGLKLAFVFDGKPPELKRKEIDRRRKLKKAAQQEYEIAKERRDFGAMKKYASRTSRLTPDMVAEAKKLIRGLGLPIIDAPSEGEAQAAYMVKHGEAWAEVSQDFDCLLFGVPRLVRNLSLSERRKLPGKLGYQTVKPEIFDLAENLSRLKINQDQLIAVGILVGTDFNVGGVHGIGPRKALNLVIKHGDDLDAVFDEAGWGDEELDWREIHRAITHIPTTREYDFTWEQTDEDSIVKLLCDEHDFSQERVHSTLARLRESQERRKQKGLGEFFPVSA